MPYRGSSEVKSITESMLENARLDERKNEAKRAREREEEQDRQTREATEFYTNGVAQRDAFLAKTFSEDELEQIVINQMEREPKYHAWTCVVEDKFKIFLEWATRNEKKYARERRENKRQKTITEQSKIVEAELRKMSSHWADSRPSGYYPTSHHSTPCYADDGLRLYVSILTMLDRVVPTDTIFDRSSIEKELLTNHIPINHDAEAFKRGVRPSVVDTRPILEQVEERKNSLLRAACGEGVADNDSELIAGYTFELGYVTNSAIDKWEGARDIETERNDRPVGRKPSKTILKDSSLSTGDTTLWMWEYIVDDAYVVEIKLWLNVKNLQFNDCFVMLRDLDGKCIEHYSDIRQLRFEASANYDKLRASAAKIAEVVSANEPAHEHRDPCEDDEDMSSWKSQYTIPSDEDEDDQFEYDIPEEPEGWEEKATSSDEKQQHIYPMPSKAMQIKLAIAYGVVGAAFSLLGANYVTSAMVVLGVASVVVFVLCGAIDRNAREHSNKGTWAGD